MPSRFEDIVDNIHADAALAGVPYDKHRLAQKLHADFPRVVWIRTGGTVSADEATFVGGRVSGSTREVTVRVDVASIEVHIWGADHEGAEDILHAIVSTCYRRLSGSVAFAGYSVFNEQPATADYAVRGVKFVLSLTINFAILRESRALRNVDSVEQEGNFIAYDTGNVTNVC